MRISKSHLVLIRERRNQVYSSTARRMKSVVLILIMVQSVTSQTHSVDESTPIDELLSNAAAGAELGDSFEAASFDLLSDVVRITPDRSVVITELDIAHQAPCEYTTNNVSFIQSVPGSSGIPLAGRCDAEIVPLETGSGSRRRGKRNVRKGTNIYWNLKFIPYTISNVHTSEELRVFEEVKAAYEKYTCISLIPRTNQRDYINIKRGGGCWSYVGRISGAQDMSLDTGCLYLKKTAIHEFMHALGFWHEQSRPDRDNYIDIHLENVNSGLHHNFEPQKAENVDLFGTVYDYRSVMHYSRTAFSNNRRDTITTKNPKFLDIIGRGPTFSFLDLYILHKLYTCDSECNTADRCPAGSYRGKDCQCYCSNDDINNNEPAVLCDSVTTPKPTTPMPTTSTQTTPRSTTSKPTTTFKPTTTSKPTTTPNPTISPDKECKEPNENCNCKVTGWGGYSKECRKVSKSICDTDSGKCVCKLGYKYSKRPGRRAKCVKVRIPRCSRPDEYCGCEEKGPRACARIPNSFCNTVNGTCECMNTYTSGNGWKCEKEVGGEMFQTAGDRIPPFLNQRTPINWHPDRGAEPNLQFGLQKNGYRLRAAGQGSRVWAALETPPLSERNGGQFWCISLNYNLNYGALFVEFSSADRRWKPYKVFYSEGDSPVWYPLTLKIETTGAETNMRLGARSYPWSYSGVWSVNLDPLKVYAC